MKEQRKHGCWRQFDFRNQGQCVAFVQRGADPSLKIANERG